MNLEEALSDLQLTEEKLFALYEAALREAYPTATIESHSPDSFELTLAGIKGYIIYLKNLWITIRRQPTADRVKTFQKHLHGMQEAFAESQPRREDIVPMIKDSEYLRVVDGDKPVIREHLAGDIWIVYALDLPNSIKTLTAEIMQKLALSMAELRGLACDNLRRILPEIEQYDSESWYWLTAGGDYVASILLFDEVWAELEGNVDGEIVAAVPARDVLMFTGSRSKEGIQQIRHQAREIVQNGDHVISQTLLRRVSGTWKVFE